MGICFQDEKKKETPNEEKKEENNKKKKKIKDSKKNKNNEEVDETLNKKTEEETKIFLESLYPIYPAGEPINLLIEWDSLYSLISIFIIFLVMYLANNLASIVLPTPEGPANIIDIHFG